MSPTYQLRLFACSFCLLWQLPTVAIAQKTALTNEQQNQLDEADQYHDLAIKLNGLALTNDARMAAERGYARRKAVLGESSPEVADSMSDLGLICLDQADYKPAREYLDRALAIHQKERGPEHPTTALTLERLSMVLEYQGDVLKARETIEKSVRIRKKVLGENDPSTAKSMTYLGELMRLQGEFPRAIQVSEKALELCKKIHGDEHRDTAKAYSAMGDYYTVRGDTKKAKPYYERALAIRKQLLGDQHPETAAGLLRWSIVLLDEEKVDEAQTILEKAYESNRKMRGEDHPETAYVLSTLGNAYLAKLNYESAIQAQEKVLAIYRAKFGEDHHDTAAGLTNLGETHRQKGDLDSAQKAFQKSLDFLRKFWGKEHPDVANADFSLGRLSVERGDFELAENHLTPALNSFRKFFGDDSDQVATGHFFLGVTQRAKKNYKEARQQFEMSVSRYVKNHGENYPSSITARIELAATLYDMKDLDEARKQYDKTLALQKIREGTESPEVAEIANILGIIHYDQANYIEARKHYNDALAIQFKVFGENDLRTATTQYNIGLLLQAQKKDADAILFLNRAFETRKKILGEDHAQTKLALSAVDKLALQPPPGLAAPPSEMAAPPPVAPSAMADVAAPPLPRVVDPVAPRPPLAPVVATPNSSAVSSANAGTELFTPQEFASLSEPQRQKLQGILAQFQTAMGLFQKGQMKEFLPIVEKLSSDFIEIMGSSHKVAVTLVTLHGSTLLALGEFDAAKPLLEQSLKSQLSITGEQDLQTAVILLSLAKCHAAVNSLTTSKQYADRCYEIRKALLGDNHPETGMALAQLGAIAVSSYDFDLAKTHYDKALTILRKSIRPDDPNPQLTASNLASVASGLAFAHSHSGNFLVALKFYRIVLDLRRNVFGEQHPETAISYVETGVMQYSMGDIQSTQQNFEKALQIFQNSFGSNHPTVAATRMGLAEICIAQKKFSDAKNHLDKALTIQKQTYGENSVDYAKAILSLASLARETGDLTAARTHLDRSLSITQQQVGRDNYANAPGLHSLSELLQLQGKYADAKPVAENLVHILENSAAKESFDLAVALGGVSAASAGANSWTEAVEHMDRARRFVRKCAMEILPGLSEQELLTCLRNADEEFWHMALSMGLVRKDDPSIVEASAAWLINGKGTAQESLARQQAVRRKNVEGAAIVKHASGNWNELETVRDALPSDSVLIDIARIRVRNFSSKKREDQWGSARYVAWVIPPKGNASVKIIDLGDAESIDAIVTEFNKVMKASMTAGSTKGTIQQLGEAEATKLIDKPLQALASRLIEPLRADLAATPKILLSPDASLWLVPWASLPVSNEKYLIEDHSLQMIVSSRDLVRSKPTDVKHTPPIIIADPGFDLNNQQIQAATKAVLRTNYTELQPNGLRSALITGEIPKVKRLPYTAVEAQSILPSVELISKEKPVVYTGEYALEGVFKKVNQPKLLVISTHGVFLPAKLNKTLPNQSFVSASAKSGNALVGPTENPLLRCGLLLAGCNQRPASNSDDDGILTGEEIVGCNLLGTEMVVLSACETGLGEVRNGDGVAGLRQAFQLAGAESVVATLWTIDDRESAFFMRDFFKQLGEGESRADAMRNAQLSRIEARRNRFGTAHPFYWAAWTLTDGLE